MSKYTVPANEGDDYRSYNLLELTEDEHIDLAEYSGAFWAEVAFTESLISETRFTVKYLLALHLRAFGHLYAFAGALRTVNLSAEVTQPSRGRRQTAFGAVPEGPPFGRKQ